MGTNKGTDMTTKNKKKTQKKTKATSGQSGPPMEKELSDLNQKEIRVLMFANGEGSGKRPEVTITEMAEGCWKSKSKAVSNSWTRNSLRRLVRTGMIEKLERGLYQISVSARKQINAKHAEQAAKKAA